MNVGGLALLNYGEPGPIWHSRVLLAHAGDQDWAILTPDHDVYIETMANENPDLVGFYYCGEGGVIPPGVNPADVYAFRPLTPAQLGAFRIQGEALAVAEKARRGIALAPVPPAPPPAAAGPPVVPVPVVPVHGPTNTWVALEDGGHLRKGDVIAVDPNPLPAGHMILGERGLCPIPWGSILMKKVPANEVASYRLDDLRVLPIEFDSQGGRRREFPTAVAALDDSEPAGGGIQLTGPRTAMRLLKDLREQSFTPGTFHEYWLRTSDISKGDRSVYEHECLSRILESMLVTDQLNAPALQSAELICRRLQVIREAHRISPGAPDYSSADIMMGWRFRRAGPGIDTSLAKHVAEELKAEASIQKEARKAREEQALRRKGRGNKAKPEGGAET